MNNTEKVIIATAKALVATCIVLAKVMVALVSVGSNTSGTASRSRTSQSQGVYPKVRGYRQTKGHWNNTGPMGGRTHERYRHGH